MEARLPTYKQTFDALRVIGATLDEEWAYFAKGAYHFKLGDDWTVSASPESAARVRLEAHHGGRSRCSIWSPVDDHPRLRGVVLELACEVHALVG